MVMRELVFRARMLFYKHRYWRPIEGMTQNPASAQKKVMLQLLYMNRNTRFGKEHSFAKIRNHFELQQNVPVQHYDALHPYIEEQRLLGAQALTAEQPLFYAQTSGTTGKPKYIPITSTGLAMYRQEQALFSYLQYQVCPTGFTGKALGVMGAAVEGYLDSKHAVGSVSGHLYQSLPKIIQSRFVLPPSVSNIADYELKYLVILRLALAEPNITYAGSPNPSTFLRLLDVLNQQRESLTRSLVTGRLDELSKLEKSLANSLERLLKPDPVRASQISDLPELSYANVWPELKLVTTWMGGSCGIALDSLRKKLPATTTIMELGYQSSEFRGSIALEAENPAGMPPLHHHFFEFVEQALWDNQTPVFLTLDQITLGKIYYVIITTAAGLYRYFMNDLVEVTGFINSTPLLRFVQKGKGVTSLTGEKLYEAQAISAVKDVSLLYGLDSSFYVLVANEQALHYCLFMEAKNSVSSNINSIAAKIDTQLGELNMEYQAKRNSGRLGPLTLSWLKSGTAEAYKAAHVSSGQREGQYKPTVLQYSRDLRLALQDFAIK